MTPKPKILVIDDDEPLLRLMGDVLTQFKFQPLVASSGSAALELATRERPRLILLDKNMPGMKGEEVIRAFQSNKLFRDVPILILSGDPVSPQELRALGARGAVQKPFDVTALIAQIRSNLLPTDKTRSQS